MKVVLQLLKTGLPARIVEPLSRLFELLAKPRLVELVCDCDELHHLLDLRHDDVTVSTVLRLAWRVGRCVWFQIGSRASCKRTWYSACRTKGLRTCDAIGKSPTGLRAPACDLRLRPCVSSRTLRNSKVVSWREAAFNVVAQTIIGCQQATKQVGWSLAAFDRNTAYARADRGVRLQGSGFSHKIFHASRWFVENARA